jgi:hypothetical protein
MYVICRYILETFGQFYGQLVYFSVNWYTYFMTSWNIFRSFGILFPILVCCSKKNLAALVPTIETNPPDCFPMLSKVRIHRGRSLRGNRTIQCLDHRNLRSRTSMLAQALQIFWGKDYLVKNRLISTLDNVIYFKGTIFQRSTKPLFTSQNRVEIS